MADMVKISDVASLGDEACVDLTASQRRLRQGPFTIYTDNTSRERVDDFTFEAGAGAVIVPAYGQVLDASGHVCAVLEQGAFCATKHVHVVLPHDPVDGAYLWRAISTTSGPARQVEGSPQLKSIPARSLMAARIPWPDTRQRSIYVGALDLADRRTRELRDSVPQLLAQGDALFAEIVRASGEAETPCGEVASWSAGTNVPANLRSPDKPVRIEGPHGDLGHCDEALTSGPAILVGPSARRLLAHFVTDATHPIGEMRYVEQDGCTVPIEVLFFALREAGLFDRVRLHDTLLEAPTLTVDDLADLQLHLGTPQAQEQFAPQAHVLLQTICQAQEDLRQIGLARAKLTRHFSATGELPTSDIAYDLLVGPATQGVDAGAEATASKTEEVAAAPHVKVARPAHPLVELRDTLASQTGMAPADIAWEIAPLVTMRVVAGAEAWHTLTEACATQEPAVAINLLQAQLAARDEGLAFLTCFSYASSLLDAQRLAQLVADVDAISPEAIDAFGIGALMRVPQGGPAASGDTARLFASVAQAAAMSTAPADNPTWQPSVYLPVDHGMSASTAAARLDPAPALTLQLDDLADCLPALMAWAVERCRASQTDEPRQKAAKPAAYTGPGLATDAVPQLKADVVVASLPLDNAEWSATAPSKDDPRWGVLGLPPRNKANYAWLQHCLWHTREGGLAVLMVTNAVLHASMGMEQTLRETLARSGRVRLVAALPAGVTGAPEVPPVSILVLGDERPADEARCLMVDALALGTDIEGERAAGEPRRAIDPALASQIAAVCEDWLVRGTAPADPALACVATTSDLEAADCVLTPWTYVHP